MIQNRGGPLEQVPLLYMSNTEQHLGHRVVVGLNMLDTVQRAGILDTVGERRLSTADKISDRHHQMALFPFNLANFFTRQSNRNQFPLRRERPERI